MAFLTRHYALCENELRSILEVAWKREQSTSRAAQEVASDNKLKLFILRHVIQKWAFSMDGPMRKNIIQEMTPIDNSGAAKKLGDVLRKGIEQLGESFEADIVAGIRGCLGVRHNSLSSEENMTMGSMASYLEESISRMLSKLDERELILEFARRLRECGSERNRVVHGAIGDFFERVAIKGQKEHAWQRPVISFIRMRLLFPHAVPILKRLMNVPGGEGGQIADHGDERFR